MTLKVRHIGDMALGPGENPCSDIPFAALLEGEILVQASASAGSPRGPREPVEGGDRWLGD